MSSSAWIIAGGAAFWLLTCLALLDIARKDFGGMEKKALWAIVAALVPFLGVLAYAIFGYKRGKRPGAAG